MDLFGSGWDSWIAFVNTVMNIFFHKGGGGLFLLYVKVSSFSTLLYITQFINTYIAPVCPDHLILRYCICNTYLLYRRTELKAAPGSTWLMRNWTLGNNEPLAVSTYISGVISCCSRNEWKQLTFVSSGRLFCITNIIYECFLHNSPSISYRVVTG